MKTIDGENQKFIYAGAIIFNDFSAKKIAEIIDGKVDFLLIDTEKKIISKKKNIYVRGGWPPPFDKGFSLTISSKKIMKIFVREFRKAIILY